jgi:hypothetical protein
MMAKPINGTDRRCPRDPQRMTDQFADGRKQEAHVQRLFQKRPRSKGFNPVPLIWMSRHDHNRQFRMRRGHRLKGLPTIHFGHAEIQENKIKPLAPDALQRQPTILGQNDRKSLAPQQPTQRLPNGWQIIHKQQSRPGEMPLRTGQSSFPAVTGGCWKYWVHSGVIHWVLPVCSSDESVGTLQSKSDWHAKGVAVEKLNISAPNHPTPWNIASSAGHSVATAAR